MKSFLKVGVAVVAAMTQVAVFYGSVCAQSASAIRMSPVKVGLQLVTDQLSYPTAFAAPNDKSGRLFVCEQAGRIRIIKKGNLQTEPLLDFAPEVFMTASADERGLLGLALHPDFLKNGKLYVYFSSRIPKTPGVDHKSVIREYTVSKQNPDLVDKASARDVLTINEPESNHNGGDLKFGPDGYLYIGVGDGGAYNDLHGAYGNGQNMNTLLGKILRIDVNAVPYAIPKDNPFVGKENMKPEIYAYGLRNPWRISFDRQDGRLFAGDVGQKNWEEVNIITKGGNFGWRVREGTHVKFPNDPDPKNWINPIIDYGRQEGISITGGFLYRGKCIPELRGKYVFGDLMGPVWALTDVKKALWQIERLSISKEPGIWQIYSFGEDQEGELYILANILEAEKGAVYKIVPGE
ncbi:PQQ-dependent sugar dehydrogenase [Pedobacter faecalis]|uniref:PQQ-dependent sugar dehydrogenase n=1 Tax=Pedobacter faecalis TaxID=3041495 RepID=UPI00254B3D79|nr:PQQ-dependent sugar dehydrogenase [Pedobacter sp. ELA7]